MDENITYVALDTHKKEHTVAWIDPQTGGLAVFTVRNLLRDIAKMVKKLQRKAPGPVRFCYEAGVCGFTLKRRIEALGSDCAVIAPSLVPVKQGDRLKTDRRDACKLLGQFIAGQLTKVQAPDIAQEAAREITRCREAARENLNRIRHQALKFLSRHGVVYGEGRHWTAKHLRWLRSLEFDTPDLCAVFDWHLGELEHCQQRLATLDKQVTALAERPAYREAVGRLRCLRGIETLTAVMLVTEVFDFGRFDSPRQLMGFLGLVPSEHSSGDKRRPGAITKTGNKRARRLLIESAWHYRHRVGVSRTLQQRRIGQPAWVIDAADRALIRLHQRYRRLLARGKNPKVVAVAIARELAGFIWALLHDDLSRPLPVGL